MIPLPGEAEGLRDGGVQFAASRELYRKGTTRHGPPRFALRAVHSWRYRAGNPDSTQAVCELFS